MDFCNVNSVLLELIILLAVNSGFDVLVGGGCINSHFYLFLLSSIVCYSGSTISLIDINKLLGYVFVLFYWLHLPISLYNELQ